MIAAKEKEEESIPFNGSLDTLARIHTLIIDISDYRINQNWLGMKENLGELLNESQGCLNKAEFSKAWKDWDKIDSFEISINEDGVITFDSDLPRRLKKFSSWLRLRLYKHNLTMAKSFKGIDKMLNLTRRYNI